MSNLENELEVARTNEGEALKKFNTAGTVDEEIDGLNIEQLTALQEKLQVQRSEASAKLVRIEGELRSVSETLYKKKN